MMRHSRPFVLVGASIAVWKRWATFAAALTLTGPLVIVGATGTANAICTEVPARVTEGVPLCPPIDPSTGYWVDSNPYDGLPPCTPGYRVQSACSPLATQPAAVPPTRPSPASPANSRSPQSLSGADAQGFLNYSGARCKATNPAVAIARTAKSVVVICQTGVGRFYYRGFGLQNGGSVEIDDPVRNGAGFVATNNGVHYSVAPNALTITQGSKVLSAEPMLEYWSQ